MRLLFLTFLFTSHISSASAISVNCISDTTINPGKKEHKISQRKFIDQFRNNNNAIIVIKYFFKKRNRSGWVPIVISLPIAMAAAILAVFAPVSLIVIFLLLLITGGIVLSTIGLVYLLVFPRKRLWRVLAEYSESGLLSKNLKRKLGI